VIPESSAEFEASFCQAQEAVSAIAIRVTAGAAADLSPGHLTANVIFRSVGVERDFGPVEHQEQLGLVFVQPFEQTVETNPVLSVKMRSNLATRTTLLRLVARWR
jgi:hypothetical protein